MFRDPLKRQSTMKDTIETGGSIASTTTSMETEQESTTMKSEQETTNNLPEAYDSEREWMDDRLWRIGERTKLDGTTETEVVEWMPDDYGGDKPRIRFEHPLKPSKTITHTFGMPTAETDENEFVRFLGQYGLSLKTANEIKEFSIDVEYNENGKNDWTPIIPEYEEPAPTMKERVKGISSTVEEFIGGAYDMLFESTVVVSSAIVFTFLLIVAFSPITALPVGYTVKKGVSDRRSNGNFEAFCATLLLLVGCLVFWTIFGTVDGATTNILFDNYANAQGETVLNWDPMEFDL